MQPAENKDYSRDVILRLSPTRNTIIVEEQKPGGIAAYRGILCAGILRDRPTGGQGGINSDSAKNGKEQFFEKDRAVSNYQPDAFGLQVL